MNELEDCGKNLFEKFRKEFELKIEEIEKLDLRQGYQKPKMPTDVCERCHKVTHTIVPWRVHPSGRYLQWCCLGCFEDIKRGRQ